MQRSSVAYKILCQAILLFRHSQIPTLGLAQQYAANVLGVAFTIAAVLRSTRHAIRESSSAFDKRLHPLRLDIHRIQGQLKFAFVQAIRRGF
jgi:hypothetical protein